MFESNKFLQTPYTDNGCFYSITKLRNSNTTAVSDYFKYEKFNQGIYIDIFPLDTYNKDCLEEKFCLIKNFIGDLSTYMRRNNPELNDAQLERVRNYSGRDPYVTYDLIQQLCRADENRSCEYKGILVVGVYDVMKQSYPSKYWDEYETIDFYGIQVPIPKHYHEILRQTYGDYMSYPPPESRGVWHVGATIDPDRPYTDYLCRL